MILEVGQTSKSSWTDSTLLTDFFFAGLQKEQVTIEVAYESF